MEGQLLQDRYLMKRSLGQNTLRNGQQTFLAIDEVANQPVAIKILRFGPGFEWEHLKLFQREAAILQSLDHAAIPQYLDSFELDMPDCQGFALVQTYIDAQSLEEHLRRGRAFSMTEVVEIASQLLHILTIFTATFHRSFIEILNPAMCCCAIARLTLQARFI